MKKGTGLMLIISFVVLILIIIVVKSYSSLSSLKSDVINREADLNVQLNRKIEDISSLINEVKDENKIEGIEGIIDNLKKAEDIDKKAKLNNELSNEINEQIGNFTEEEVSELKEYIDRVISTEKRFKNAVKNYNDAVNDYNNKVGGFPSSIIAKIRGYNKYNEFIMSSEINSLDE